VFRDIAEVLLYRSMNLAFIEPYSVSTWKALQRICDHRYADLVLEMRVELHECTKSPPSQECFGESMDRQLGDALRSMNALQVLGIKCYLCVKPINGRHQYLLDLPTRRLRELSINWACTTGPGFDRRKFLTAQYMRSVTALNWGGGYIPSIQAEMLRQQMRDLDFLPNIDTIQYYGPGVWEELLATRKIRRLSSLAFDASGALNRNPNKELITHLILNGCDISRFFGDITVTDQFCNLQHVGTLIVWDGILPLSGNCTPLPTREGVVSIVILPYYS
jgi:hypothetical protein